MVPNALQHLPAVRPVELAAVLELAHNQARVNIVCLGERENVFLRVERPDAGNELLQVILRDQERGRFAVPFPFDFRQRRRDREALAAGLADGTIDCAVSDHTPVDEDQKLLPFAEAEPGATGLELLLPLALKWGMERKLALAQTLARITSEPARILGVASGRIEPGAPADLALFDPQAAWRVTPQALKSQGKNSPFLGMELAGRVRTTIVAGNVVYEA